MSKDNCCGVQGIPNHLFFKALGDPNRLRILAHLIEMQERLTVSQIAKRFPIDLSVVSRHLAILRDAGILISDKRGKEVFYTVNHNHLASCLTDFAGVIESCCPEVLGKEPERS